MFRYGTSSSRTLSLAPPSAYPGRSPVTSSDPFDESRSVSRRVSRADMDFEQVLKGGDTVKLREGPDLSLLGITDSPITSKHQQISTPSRDSQRYQQPATPNVIPPTPEIGSSQTQATVSSPIQSSLDRVQKPNNEPEVQSKRRSVLRSPGTASSPDLATLIKKAKERTRAEAKASKKDHPTNTRPSSSGLSGGNRPRSSTQNLGSNSPSSYRYAQPDPNATLKGKGPAHGVDSSQTHISRTAPSQNGKSSMRQKTAAFLNRLKGGSLRDRNFPSPNVESNQPPVPSLPDQYRVQNPKSPSFTDVFSSDLDSTNPPPLVVRSRSRADSDEDYGQVLPGQGSMIRPSLEGVQVPPKGLHVEDAKSEASMQSSHKRTDSKSSIRSRSLSTSSIPNKDIVLDANRKHVVRSSEDTIRSDWDTTMRGIMSTFDQFGSFDPSNLENTLFTTPLKKRLPIPEHTNPYQSPSTNNTNHFSELSRRSSLPRTIGGSSPAITSNRAASLDVPTNPSSRYCNRTSQRQGQRTLPTRPPFTNVFSDVMPDSPVTKQAAESLRLKMHSRSPASASEPALLGMLGPRPTDSPGSTVRLVSSLNKAQPGERRGSIDSSAPPNVPQLTSSQVTSSDELESRGNELAMRCWEEDSTFLVQDKIAEWLGGAGLINKVSLKYYMQKFDLHNLRLDDAFRRMCSKLFLKAESQQLDRILEEFARRYWECNPHALYGSANTVHAVACSILLLNTDLHIAEIPTHMSKTQFVKNTLQVIRSSVDGSSAPSSSKTSVDVLLTTDNSDCHHLAKNAASVNGEVSGEPLISLIGSREAARSQLSRSFGPSDRSISSQSRNWESEMENLLKDLFNSVKNQQILQATLQPPSERSLNPNSPSLSRTSSRLKTRKRGSVRGLPSLGVSPYSSNSSVDGRISPSPSFATSNADAFSASSSSFFSAPTFGFASNLTHTIIRESEEHDGRSIRSEGSESTNVSVSDAELALLGPPFAKEGSLSRKQYWEATGRRAKSKNWVDVFVVIQKGDLDMFIFGAGDSVNAPVVGGGNWLSNASHVGSLNLAHSLAHPLPPPGYSRQRPYCFVLTLASGAVYFFQAGTEDLVNEWVSTCNYWAARQSKEPLPGGVSNMEYGWNRVLSKRENDDRGDTMSTRSARSIFSKRSLAGSLKDRNGSPFSDRIFINEWKPPLPPSIPSTLDEEAQLAAMEKQVAALNEELETHQSLQFAMTELYLPRSANYNKAIQNWKNKSQYLTSEIVKYDIYVDALKVAMALRHEKRGEKVLERALVSIGDDSNTNIRRPHKKSSNVTIDETVTSVPGNDSFTGR